MWGFFKKKKKHEFIEMMEQHLDKLNDSIFQNDFHTAMEESTYIKESMSVFIKNTWDTRDISKDIDEVIECSKRL